MRILADADLPLAAEAFAAFGEVKLAPGRTFTPALVRDCDALLVRAVTRVDARLLEGSRVRFVGTATSGLDHVDAGWLASRGIALATAHGANATAVAEYVLSAIAGLADEAGTATDGLTVGIVGLGAVGSRLAARLPGLGCRALACDPPRERAGDSGPFVALDTLLTQADVVTLHVPLTGAGPDATRHLLDARRLALLRPGAILVNAARGEILDEAAALAGRPDLRLVIDCWAGEPVWSQATLQAARIATPHIAGYTLEARVGATRLLHGALARHAGREVPWPLPASALPAVATVTADEVADPAAGAGRWLLRCYDVRRDAGLRSGLGRPPAERAALFDRLRRERALRHEFAHQRLRAPRGACAERLRALGFTVVTGAAAPN